MPRKPNCQIQGVEISPDCLRFKYQRRPQPSSEPYRLEVPKSMLGWDAAQLANANPPSADQVFLWINVDLMTNIGGRCMIERCQGPHWVIQNINAVEEREATIVFTGYCRPWLRDWP